VETYYYGHQSTLSVSDLLSTNPAKPICRRFPGDIQDTFLKKTSRRFVHDKPYNIKMQLKFVMSDDLLLFQF